MNNVDIILLSGGSGKRLWPLSNGIRSKQFLKLLKDPKGNPESMIQRVTRQISESGIKADVCVSTSKLQVDPVLSQLGGNADIVAEPSLRDTFPAIVLATTYLLKTKNREEDDIAVIMPSDPYTEANYFNTISKMIAAVKDDVADLVLMGIKPTEPSTKFGYIVPLEGGEVKKVSKFAEKPNEIVAKELIKQGAMWNGGVFAFKLGFLKKYAEKYLERKSFEYVRDNYELLPKISFDYEVAERAESVAVVEFSGQWEDLGTWDNLSARIDDKIGNARICNSENTTVINELNLPVVSLGLKNAIVVASADGILVGDKSESVNLKNHLEGIDQRPMYEERRWGKYKVLEQDTLPNGKKFLVKFLQLGDGKHISYQRHTKRDEIWTFINGKGIFVLDGEAREVSTGDVAQIKAGHMHAVKGVDNLQIIEVQLGDELTEEDIERFDYSWTL